MAGGARVPTSPRAESLAREIRRAVARSGGSLVAAASAPGRGRGRHVARSQNAHQGLLEIRYFLYLARRLACLDLKKYKELSALQEAALRELASLLRLGGSSLRGSWRASF